MLPEDIYRCMLYNFNDTLQATSRDDSNKEYMTTCQEQVVNFDDFTVAFAKELRTIESCSCDALYMFSSEAFFLIEFKNGEINPSNIRNKICESLLMLLEKFDITIAFTRKYFSFVLVYNEKNYKIFLQDHIFKNANESLKRFGVERYEKLYFKAAYTYSKAKFEAEFISKYCTG